MKKYKYIIVGGGMAADAAVAGIREVDQNNSILLMSDENDPPYNRPPLTKSLWKGTPIDQIWKHTEEKNADILLNTKVTSIDPDVNHVATNDGRAFQFEKLLLATGGKVRKLPFGGELVHYYRTLSDFREVRKIANQNKKFAVIGSGFIGSELAAALSIDGNPVTLFDMGSGIGQNIFPPDMVGFLNAYYEEKNVEIVTDFKVKNIVSREGKSIIIGNDGKDFKADFVVAGVGITPDIELAEKIHLEIGDGILVNQYLETSIDRIYAAGDVANFFNPLLDQRIRMEHSNNAKAMGRAAGRNMAGAKEPYDYLPFFYSDLFDLGYEAVGKLDSRFKIVADWHEKYAKGVLYYLEHERVRGVLLWNVWDKLDAAREVIGLQGPVDNKALMGKIQ